MSVFPWSQVCLRWIPKEVKDLIEAAAYALGGEHPIV